MSLFHVMTCPTFYASYLEPRNPSKSVFNVKCSITHANPYDSPNRVESLYDDLNRLKQFEPTGYIANVDVWRHALLAASKEGVLPTESGKPSKSRFVMSTGDQLLKALETRQFGVPQSLGLVLVCV
jgi:hypothetical protein